MFGGRYAVVRIATVALLAPSFGCGRPESAADQKLSHLQDEISKVQSDHDRIDQRLSALEIDAADRKNRSLDAASAAAGPAAAAAADEPARTKVVRLRPPGEGGEPGAAGPAGTDDGTPRPSIRVTGAVAPGGKRARITGTGDQIEQTIPEEGAAPRPTGRPSALDPDAKRSYDGALALVQGRQYDKALEAFAGFLVRWPDHPYADNALYWRGECYFAQGDYSRAAEQFDGTISRFPTGNKVPDALLKLGMCQRKLGLSAKAKVTFDRLAREFPRSEAARRIPREETP